MNVGIVGCGYVANYYATTLPNHPELKLVGVTDLDPERAASFARVYGAPQYRSLAELLEGPAELILNLTNPHNHYEVSRACLLAGKHVYTEKPVALAFDEAARLAELAHERKLILASAPCILLGQYAQGIWKALRDDEIGRPRLVYAQLDDGAVHHMRYWTWISRSGTPWPHQNEFQVGSVIEHANYCLSLLTSYFGPARVVQAHSRCLVPEKLGAEGPEVRGPDYSEVSLEFHSGVVAQVRIGSVAPHEHSLVIVGDEGVLSTRDLYWNLEQKVYIRRRIRVSSKQRKDSHVYLTPDEEYHFAKPAPFHFKSDDEVNVDWAMGPAEVAAAVRAGRRCRLDMDQAVHVMEILDVIQNAGMSGPVELKSRFEPIEPADWIQDQPRLRSA